MNNAWLRLQEYEDERLAEIQRQLEDAIDGYLASVGEEYYKALGQMNPSWAAKINEQAKTFLAAYLKLVKQS